MRLVATLKTLEAAMSFRALLETEGIESVCESGAPKGPESAEFYIWAIREEELEKAVELFERFQKDPAIAPKAPEEKEVVPPPPPPSKSRAQVPFKSPFTVSVIALCAVLFVINLMLGWSLAKKHPAVERYFPQTSLDMAMMYDYPTILQKYREFLIKHPDYTIDDQGSISTESRMELSRILQTPTWEGLYFMWLHPDKEMPGPSFTEIREGQVWRVFSPALMHTSFLHILFNMLWVWILGRFIERNIKAARYLLMIVIIAIISNTCQYLMSGPNFFGFSGVICGFAGFVFIRQRCAPWEGYPIPKATLVFLGIFIVGMALLQLVSFFMEKYGSAMLSLTIANTAHISGAIVGMILAKIRMFEAQ